MNHLELLKKYMACIVHYEGDDFTHDTGLKEECTPEEYAEIKRISEEVWDER